MHLGHSMPNQWPTQILQFSFQHTSMGVMNTQQLFAPNSSFPRYGPLKNIATPPFSPFKLRQWFFAFSEAYISKLGEDILLQIVTLGEWHPIS